MKNAFLAGIVLVLFTSCGSDTIKLDPNSTLIINKSTDDYKIKVYVKSEKSAENSLSWQMSNRELIAYNLPFIQVASLAMNEPTKFFTANVSDSVKNSFFDIQVNKPLSNILSDSSMWKTVLYELSAYYNVKKIEHFKTVESHVIYVAEPDLLASFIPGNIQETKFENDSLKLEKTSVNHLASFLNHTCDLNVVTDVEAKTTYKIHIKKTCDQLELQRELERYGLGIDEETRPHIFYTLSQQFKISKAPFSAKSYTSGTAVFQAVLL